MPKTGGMFIRNACERHMPADWIVRNPPGDHSGARHIPEEHGGLPVFGLVRNPWDWYVSWYHFVTAQHARGEGDPDDEGWELFFDEGRASFAEMVTAACTGIPRRGREAPPWLQSMRESGVDFFTFHCGDMFLGRTPAPVPPSMRGERWGPVEVGHMETLREDFLSFLRRHDVPVGEELIAHVRHGAPDNVTPHPPYTSYYDEGLREVVRQTSRVARRFGYSYDDAPAGEVGEPT